MTVAAGGRAAVALTVPAAALRHWDTKAQRYVVDPGTYELKVGASAADIRATAKVEVGP